MTTALAAILIFGLLIATHELGHFLVAKMVGIRVHEFSIGMGPVVLSWKRGETIYSLRLLPIGGFNRMAGMESGDLQDPRGFNTRSVLQRMAVIASGSLMNFLLAIILFIFVFMGIGVPSNTTTIGGLLPGRPAEEAGFQVGDRIVSINNTNVNTWGQLVEVIHKNPGQKLQVMVERDQQSLLIPVVPELDPQNKVGLIGIEQTWVKLGLFSSILLGVQQALAVAALIITSLIKMITGQLPAEVAGPVGIVQMAGEAARLGLANVLNFAGLLSLNLGIINLFPIPALDGSRLLFLGIEGIRGRPVNPEKENIIHLVGFALLIFLMLVITYQDLLRLFS
ncbi:MAG: RIP metalloprotease RseP [Syntrophomonadaceae bacterium]|nr:RIP metalloprotease RseP [Syntrophomonadaceae bacterium]